MKSHLGHSTPGCLPVTWSGQGPMVVPCSWLALVGVLEECWPGAGELWPGGVTMERRPGARGRPRPDIENPNMDKESNLDGTHPKISTDSGCWSWSSWRWWRGCCWCCPPWLSPPHCLISWPHHWDQCRCYDQRLAPALTSETLSQIQHTAGWRRLQTHTWTSPSPAHSAPDCGQPGCDPGMTWLSWNSVCR